MYKLIKNIFHFYQEGFQKLPRWGRTLWLIILIKLFIMFGVLKVFFFPNYLKKEFTSNEERSNHVIEQITNK